MEPPNPPNNNIDEGWREQRRQAQQQSQPEQHVQPNNIDEELNMAITEGNLNKVQELLSNPNINLNKQIEGKLPLITAIIMLDTNDEARVKIFDLLLAQPNIDVNIEVETSKHSTTPLFVGILAGKLGKKYAIKKLLEHPNIDVNKVHGLGKVPIIHIVTQIKEPNMQNIFRLFLRNPRVDLDVVDNDGKSLEEILQNLNHTEYVPFIQLFRNQRANGGALVQPNTEGMSDDEAYEVVLLYNAFKNEADDTEELFTILTKNPYTEKDTEKLKEFLSNPNKRYDINAYYAPETITTIHAGYTPIMIAINRDLINTSKFLSEFDKVDINKFGLRDTLNPFLIFVKKGDPTRDYNNNLNQFRKDVLLKNPRFDPNVKNKKGTALIHRIIDNIYNIPNVLKYYVEELIGSNKNFDINIQDSQLNTPLHYLTIRNPTSIDIFYMTETEVDAANVRGITPLLFFVSKSGLIARLSNADRKRVFQHFLLMNANPFIEDYSGMKAADYLKDYPLYLENLQEYVVNYLKKNKL